MGREVFLVFLCLSNEGIQLIKYLKKSIIIFSPSCPIKLITNINVHLNVPKQFPEVNSLHIHGFLGPSKLSHTILLQELLILHFSGVWLNMAFLLLGNSFWTIPRSRCLQILVQTRYEPASITTPIYHYIIYILV